MEKTPPRRSHRLHEPRGDRRARIGHQGTNEPGIRVEPVDPGGEERGYDPVHVAWDRSAHGALGRLADGDWTIQRGRVAARGHSRALVTSSAARFVRIS